MSRAETRLGEAVLVTWVDSVSTDSWQEDKEAKAIKPSSITSVGWIVQSDETRLVLAGTVERDHVCMVTVIPAPAILSVEMLCDILG